MIVQDRQVFGDIGLLHGAGLHELADAARPVMQGLQEKQPAGLGKDGKEPRD